MILLLIVATFLWLLAGLPLLVQSPLLAGKVDLGWAGMFFFGLWLLSGGVAALWARVRAPAQHG